MLMRILITGSNGLTGQKLIGELQRRQHQDYIGISRGENRNPDLPNSQYASIDITDRKALLESIQSYQPDLIIHTAAMPNVDHCAQHPEACYATNVEAVKTLVEACRTDGIKLVHLSTDFVFDGQNGPYDEQATTSPISIYGQSKEQAEQSIIDSGIQAVIVRTILVYGTCHAMSRSNIVLWARAALSKGEPIRIVNDQFRMPTLAEDLAWACIEAGLRPVTGIFHISGPDFISVYDLVKAVAKQAGYDEHLVVPVTSEALQQPADRPPTTGFVLDKAIQQLNYKPKSFLEGLQILESQLS